jgi:selenide,water dikinase
MASLNDRAARAVRSVGARAVTDVTGFGLLGHLHEILRVSGLSAEIDVDAVPVIEGAAQLLADGYFPGGSGRNVEAVAAFVDGTYEIDTLRMLADAQTSGGLLIATSDPDRLHAALVAEDASGWTIGRLTADDGTRILLRGTASSR